MIKWKRCRRRLSWPNKCTLLAFAWRNARNTTLRTDNAPTYKSSMLLLCQPIQLPGHDIATSPSRWTQLTGDSKDIQNTSNMAYFCIMPSHRNIIHMKLLCYILCFFILLLSRSTFASSIFQSKDIP
jgi:hypothetical protein